MGYATSKKVSKKVGNEVEIRTKIAASFLAPLHPIPRLRSVKRFQAELKKTQIGLPRRCSACGWGDSLKMEALNPSLETSESELVQKAGAGCREAFYQLVQPCERVLFASAMAILNNEADAEEAAQEAVLKAFTNISRFRGECKFSTWIIQICINEARAKIRKARRYLYESIDEPENGEDGVYFPPRLRRLAGDSFRGAPAQGVARSPATRHGVAAGEVSRGADSTRHPTSLN